MNVNQVKVTSKCNSHWLVEFAERHTIQKAKQVTYINTKDLLDKHLTANFTMED